jgi:uncharacterized membrane protein
LLHEILHFFGRAICHQLEERSLQVSGEALVVCARDTGIYIGIFSTLIYLHLFKRKKNITIPSIKTSLLLLIFLVPLIVDGLGSYTNLFESNNSRRLVTGIAFGFVLPYFIYPLLSNKSLAQTGEPLISKDLLIPLLLCSVLGGLIYWGNLSYYVVDCMIIFTVIVWFGLCGSFLFSAINNTILKWGLSVFSCLTFLSLLSLLHSQFQNYIIQ